MRRFYVRKENINEKSITLDADETRHLRDVLRLRAGGNANVFDGEGSEYSCVIESIGRKEAILTITERIEPVSTESPLDLTLAVALLKGEKFDLVIQKAVELGVNTLVPLQTARCDAKLRDGGKKLERWRKIALEASKQSGRAKLMKVEEPAAFDAFIKDTGEAILFSERGGESFTSIKPDKKLTAVIGPEGGWEDSEIEIARNKGMTIVTLGGRILRAETAAISIASILQHRFGDLS